MRTPGRGHEALRRHRISLPGASYFLTLCALERKDGLTALAIGTAIREEIHAMEIDGIWSLRAGVVMPDHLHLLVRVTREISLSRCVARLKAKTKVVLSCGGLSWQGNFYEHRMRPDDSVEEVLRYLFLNPYRAGLFPTEGVYPWFWLGEAEAEWFLPMTEEGLPFSEWLK